MYKYIYKCEKENPYLWYQIKIKQKKKKNIQESGWYITKKKLYIIIIKISTDKSECWGIISDLYFWGKLRRVKTYLILFFSSRFLCVLCIQNQHQTKWKQKKSGHTIIQVAYYY